uniref:RNase H type-1 domain-containing protein n=1 Tax=Cannabis sativa TaxID=3483 RepID=A0A803NTF8_CANSA
MRVWDRHKGDAIEEVLMAAIIGQNTVEGTIKINVDGATFEANNSYGTGFIARDPNGAVMFATSSHSMGLSNASFAEMISIKEALRFG